jgi:predicted DNA-binding transcriptional regulator YafY
MNKSKRLMELMLTVNRRKKFTVRELAEQFDVSSRTILRDLQELSELGVPLYSEVGPHGGYQVLRERVLPPIAFTEGEAIAIFFANHALRHYTDLPFEAEAKSVLTKFYAFLPTDVKDRIDQMKDRVDFSIPPRQQASPYLHTLLDSSINRQPLTIEYESREGVMTRDIQPIGIYAMNGFWYCPSYCFLRCDFRRFRVDFIRSATQSKTYDQTDSQPFLSVHLGNWEAQSATSESPTVNLLAKLNRTGVRRCESELWPRPQLQVHPDGTGAISGSIPVSELSFFADFFIGLGNAAIVQEPEQLITLIRERLSAIQASYAASPSSKS